MSRFVPIPLRTVEDGRAVGDLTPNADGVVLLRVLEGGWPVGQRLESDLADADAVLARAADVVAGAEAPRPAAWPPAQAQDRVSLSVVICSLGRDARLARAVAALLDQTVAPLEVVVVDNDPEAGGVRRILIGIDDPRVRIVPEPRRGLSAARNAGLAQARGELVAFTDDDALPHRGWVEALTLTFAADARGEVACVTGLVLPEGFDTEAQLLFEEGSTFARGFRAMRWGPDEALSGPLAELTVPGLQGAAFPYTGSEFGSGNNMAFRTGALRTLGGFDEALGAGSLTQGGEDLDIFRRVHLAGLRTVYVPAALVGHHHRADLAGLIGQMYGHGTGMAAVITKVVLAGHLPAIARRMPASLVLLLSPRSVKNERKTAAFPRAATLAELRGYLHGPLLYLRARRRARQAASR